MSCLVISEQVENIRLTGYCLRTKAEKNALSGENRRPDGSEERSESVTIAITDRVTSVPIAQHSKILGA